MVQDASKVKQLRALHALQALTKSKAGSNSIQNAFREAGGIPSLVSIIQADDTPRAQMQADQQEARCRAVEALFFLTRNNADSRCSHPQASNRGWQKSWESFSNRCL